MPLPKRAQNYFRRRCLRHCLFVGAIRVGPTVSSSLPSPLAVAMCVASGSSGALCRDVRAWALMRRRRRRRRGGGGDRGIQTDCDAAVELTTDDNLFLLQSRRGSGAE
jgi:hypothetical protein